MASLSPQELVLLRRLAQWNGRLVHPSATDEDACAKYDVAVGIVHQLARHGLVARPLTLPNPDGRGSYRACLAPLTERGREVLRTVAVAS